VNFSEPPFFPGDDWDELRMAQAFHCKETLRVLASVVEQRYRDCWIVAGRPLDTVKDALDNNRGSDLRPLRAVHDVLAAFWRKKNGLTQPPLPNSTPRMGQIIDDWQRWLFDQPTIWFTVDPGLLRDCARLISGFRGVDSESPVIESWGLTSRLDRIYDFSILGLGSLDAEVE